MQQNDITQEERHTTARKGLAIGKKASHKVKLL